MSGGESLFANLRDDDRSLVAAVGKARETLKHFKTALRKTSFSEASFMVKVPFLDRSVAGDQALLRTADVAAEYPSLPIAHLWLRVNDVLDDLLFCSVFEAPECLGVKKGDSFVVQEEITEDWMIYQEGTVYGAFSLRAMRSSLAERDRTRFETHTGIYEFKDDMP